MATAIALPVKNPGTQWVDVDPTTAAEWLTRNENNRTVRLKHVNTLASDMRNGAWVVTGEAIKFSRDGRLLDGQHRLSAVVQSGVTVKMLVVTDLADAAQDRMDTGARRTAADMLHLNGFANAALLATAAKWIHLYDNDLLYVDHKMQACTNADIEACIARYGDLLLEVVSRSAGLRKSVDMAPGSLAATFFICARVDRGAADEFFARLGDGIGLPAGSPILALRNRLREIKGNRQRFGFVAELSMTLRAWNAWRSRKPMASIPVLKNGAVIKPPLPR